MDQASVHTLLALGIASVPVVLGGMVWLAVRRHRALAERAHGDCCAETCRRRHQGALCPLWHGGCWCGAE